MGARALSADRVLTNSRHDRAPVPPAEPDVMGSEPSEPVASMADQIPTDLNEPAETPPNVVPFRSMGGEPRLSAALTPAESSAFNEIARQLSARLEREYAAEPQGDEVAEPPTTESREPRIEQPADKQPEWMTTSEPPALGESRRDRALLDLLPTGILIYRFDHLLYANPAFLERTGYSSLHALNQAGGLGALYVEQGVSSTSSTSEAGTPVTIATERARPTDARLFTISWDGDSALALMFTAGQSSPVPASILENPALATRQADAEDLAAILDTTTEGILMFDASGDIHACNRRAEALFDYDGAELVKLNLVELFAPESQYAVLEYLASTQNAAADPRDAGRDVLGRAREGGLIPLSMTMGRTRPDGPNFFAVFRDQPPGKMGDGDLRDALRTAERAASARADMLARISDDLRTPLKAIIDFAEVMMSERFGPLGSERYVEHLKDIRASGERVIAIVNDLTELSRIESGKLDLAFASQNLNELVESCVSVMQPQANRERIIIRTSLAHLLPPVVVDTPSLRQITMNLIGNSILLANPGGQVIVSTALSDHGDVVLRVRDSGNDIAAARESLRTPHPPDKVSDVLPMNLWLTKALVEANRAQFHLNTTGRSGTLVEVVFVRA